jgi:hypothetical protein
MRRYRKLLILALLLAVIGAAALLFYRRAASPSTTARLLPDGDRLIYLNLKPAHLFDLSKSKPVQLEADYQDFVDKTGIQFERDLDEVAVSQLDVNGGDVASSEVFVGRFDLARLTNYLRSISSQTESYRGRTIFLVPHEGHTVRACVMDGSSVAVTNMNSTEAMHGILDRAQQPSPGPDLLREYYGHVPLGSLAWIIARFPANSSAVQVPGGFNFSFLANTVAVASLRYNGAAAVKADLIAENEDGARHIQHQVQTFLAMSRAVAGTFRPKGGDADVKAAIDSIQIAQKGNVATVTATLSEKFLKKMLSGVENEVVSGASAPSPEPTPAPPKRKP